MKLISYLIILVQMYPKDETSIIWACVYQGDKIPVILLQVY